MRFLSKDLRCQQHSRNFSSNTKLLPCKTLSFFHGRFDFTKPQMWIRVRLSSITVVDYVLEAEGRISLTSHLTPNLTLDPHARHPRGIALWTVIGQNVMQISYELCQFTIAMKSHVTLLGIPLAYSAHTTRISGNFCYTLKMAAGGRSTKSRWIKSLHAICL